MRTVKKSYILTTKQEDDVKIITEGVRSKILKYKNITCEYTFDAGVYFEPTQDELQEVDNDESMDYTSS